MAIGVRRFHRVVGLFAISGLLALCGPDAPVSAQAVAGSALQPVAVSVVNFLQAAAAPSAVAQVVSPAPTLTFPGLDDTPLPGKPATPPGISGALGPARFIETLNNNYRVWNRGDQAVVGTVAIGDFWASVGASDPIGTRVLFDHYKNRFVMTAVAGQRTPQPSLIVAVSTTADPAGEWTLARYGLSGFVCAGCWADSPALGLNKMWIAVSVNIVNDAGVFQESLVNVLNSPAWQQGTGATNTVFETDDVSIQPAYSVLEDNPIPTLYLVTHISSANATYRANFIEAKIVGGAPISALTPLYTQGPVRTHTILGPWSDLGSPGLPQATNPSGPTATIDPGDSRITSAIGSGSGVTFVQTVGLPAGGNYTHTAVQWFSVNAASTGQAESGGRIEDPAATSTNGGSWYAFPSIAAGRTREMVIGLSRFSSTSSPSAAYTVRSEFDSLFGGLFLDPRVVRGGDGYYERAFEGRNAWAGPGVTLLDPVGIPSSPSFWTLQPYARPAIAPTPDNPSGSSWGTSWGRVGFNNTFVTGVGAFDGTSPSLILEGQPFTISGWGVDLAAPTGAGPGVDAVGVALYPYPFQPVPPVFSGAATLGLSRPEVAAALGSPEFTNSGFSISIPALPVGSYTVNAQAHSTVTGAKIGIGPLTLGVRTRLGMVIDAPVSGANLRSTFRVSGWAVDLFASTGTGVDRVDVYASLNNGGTFGPPVLLGSATIGLFRPNLGFPAQFANAGYDLSVTGMAPGAYRLRVDAHSAVDGVVNQSFTRDVTVTADALMSLDGSTITTKQQPFSLTGWAIDRGAASGTGIDAVHTWAYPILNGTLGTPVFVGVATLGASRPEVAALYGNAFRNSGLFQTVSGLTAGRYRLVVSAHSSVTGTFSQSQSVDLDVTSQTVSQPVLQLDAPSNGTLLGPSFAVGGWGIDLFAPPGTPGIDTVHIWAFPKDGSSPIFVGASYGRPRQDVAALYGSQFLNSGYRIDVVDFPGGDYRMVAYAHNMVTGTFSAQQGVDVTVAAPVPAPVMAVDGPTDGQVVTQPFVTGGWAVDLGAPSGTGVDAIHVWAFPIVNGQIGAGQFVAAATMGGDRPDVGAIYGTQFAPSGFNYTMTGLTPGEYFIGVYARSTVTGSFNQQKLVRVIIQ